MNNDLLRLEKIKEERKELLGLVRNTLNNKGSEFADELSHIMSVIEYDEQSIKKYETIIKSRQLISELILETMKSNSQADIAKLRNRINYLIKSIKKELESRNISSSEMDAYNEKIKGIRKDMSRYISYLKRNSNISEIEALLNKPEDLNEEDVKKLKKLLSNERSYNTRQFKQGTDNKKVKETVKKEEKKEEIDDFILNIFRDAEPKEKEVGFILPERQEEKKEEKIDFILPERQEKKKEEKIDFILPERQEEKKEEKIDFILPERQEVKEEKLGDFVLNIPEKKDYLREKAKKSSNVSVKDLNEMFRQSLLEEDESESKINKIKRCLSINAHSFKIQYGIRDIHEYKSSFIVNVFNLLRNIPIYVLNRSKVINMVNDTNRYYKGCDLLSYIAYTRKRNSILTGLKSIFNKSYLFNGEGKYLNAHRECSKWLYDFCKRNHLSLKTLNKSL